MNRLKPFQQAEVERLLLTGLPIREVGRLTGHSKITVAKYARVLVQRTGVLICPCGKPSSHRGWCRARVQRSPVRQDFLKHFGRGKFRPKSQPQVKPVLKKTGKRIVMWEPVNISIGQGVEE